jgi:hypothetical protein
MKDNLATEESTMGLMWNEQCPACFQAKDKPARQFDGENLKVITGCVDNFHTGHLIIPSESARWHYRKVAVKIRKITERGRMGLGYE